MTTVPGHNLVIQQSGAAQELANQAHTPKPSPEQAAAQQEANIQVKNTTVQEFDASEKLKAKKEKDALKKKQRSQEAKKKKRQPEMYQDPDATGRLMDTTV
jgi:nitrate/TMAO reductase-like tetraheme cytochrome c subunit